MKHLLTTIAMCTVSALSVHSQTDNPRGIYKLTKLIDKTGSEVLAPYDQYKICTDSVTLTAIIAGNRFQIKKTDFQIFNYTGEATDSKDSTATRIFNSNDKHFTMKWWSTVDYHVYFPKNDWCTEYYSAESYSNTGNIIFKALQDIPTEDKQHPLYGNWHIIGLYDELVDVKKALKTIKKNNEQKYTGKDIAIITPQNFIYTGGQILDLESDGKTYLNISVPGNNAHLKVYRLSADYVAVAKKRNQFTDYELWKRIADNVTPLQRIAAKYM